MDDVSTDTWVNPKPHPDESNRAAIEQMLLHCYEWGVANGYITVPDQGVAVETDATIETIVP